MATIFVSPAFANVTRTFCERKRQTQDKTEAAQSTATTLMSDISLGSHSKFHQKNYLSARHDVGRGIAGYP
jgi:hypothetical protein